jgi:hypothetical protein
MCLLQRRILSEQKRDVLLKENPSGIILIHFSGNAISGTPLFSQAGLCRIKENTPV